MTKNNKGSSITLEEYFDELLGDLEVVRVSLDDAIDTLDIIETIFCHPKKDPQDTV